MSDQPRSTYMSPEEAASKQRIFKLIEKHNRKQFGPSPQEARAQTMKEIFKRRDSEITEQSAADGAEALEEERRKAAEEFAKEHPEIVNSERFRVMKEMNDRRAMELRHDDKSGAAEGIRASSRFKENYPAISNNRDLLDVAFAMDAMLEHVGDERPAEERLQQIGELLTTSSGSQEFMDALASSPSEEIALGLLRSGAVEKTASDVVAEMADVRRNPGVRQRIDAELHYDQQKARALAREGEQ